MKRTFKLSLVEDCIPVLYLLVSGIIASALIPSLAAAQGSSDITVDIKANIDGRSQIVLFGNSAKWHHFDFVAPGRQQFTNLPTTINGVDWFPQWPDIPDAENLDCNCYSDVFTGITPSLPAQSMNVNLEVLSGRGSVSIVQFPTAQNNFSIVLEFNDDPQDGPADYHVKITAIPGGTAYQCAGVPATIAGTDRNDNIQGTSGNDVIDARGGDDIVHGNGGNDLICGGDGADTIYGDDGEDTIYGQGSGDTLNGGAQDDKMYGGLGSDKMYGGNGNDYMRGEDSSDQLSGENGNDKLYGDKGRDVLSGQDGNDVLYGGSNDDKLTGGTGSDKLFGNPGYDTIDSKDGMKNNDSIDGGSGSDICANDPDPEVNCEI